MVLLFEEIIRLIFIDESEKPKWKKYKVRITPDEILVYAKSQINYPINSLTITDYTVNGIFHFECKNKDPFLMLLKKNSMEIAKFLTEKAKTTLSSKDISEVMPSMKSVNSNLTLSSQSKKKFLTLVFNPDHRKKMHQKSIQISQFVIEDNHVPIFGGNIKVIYDYYDGMPPFLEKLIKNVENGGLKKPGIYRESGAIDMIQQLKKEINIDDISKLSTYEINVQAGVIKLFFRELKPMLISHDIMDIYSNSKSGEKINDLVNYLAGLDLSIRMVLYLLIKHFEVINSHKDENLMDFYNLSVVFGPTLIESDAIEMLKAVEILKTVLDNAKILLNNQAYMNEIFESFNRLTARSAEDLSKSDYSEISNLIKTKLCFSEADLVHGSVRFEAEDFNEETELLIVQSEAEEYNTEENITTEVKKDTEPDLDNFKHKFLKGSSNNKISIQKISTESDSPKMYDFQTSISSKNSIMNLKSSLKPVKRDIKEEEMKSEKEEELVVQSPLLNKKSSAKFSKKYKIVSGPNNTFKLVYDE